MMKDDLTWLARNVHEWEQGCHYLVKTLDNGFNWIVGEMECRDNAANYYTREQWLQRRAELQNKPSWDDAPEWAEWLAQNCFGSWHFYINKPETYESEWNCHWPKTVGRTKFGQGKVLGDWRNTLERRPEKRELNPPTSSLTNAQAVEIAKEIGMCNDGNPCGTPGETGQPEYCDDCPNKGDDHPDNNLEMVGRKHDNAKPRMDLIPPKAEKLLAEVLSYGAQKYAPNNWKHVPDAHDRYIAAAMRHINSHRSGEEIDPESGLPHLAHAMCSLAFILELEA